MALLTTWGNFNKVISSSKTVYYTKTHVYGVDLVFEEMGQTYHYSDFWQSERVCKMSFEYVGMDLATAKSCAQSMTETFNRDIYPSVWSGSSAEFQDVSGGNMLMSDISIEKQQGHMYKVVVNVHERDAKSRRANTSPENLFTRENQRDYLESES